MTPLELAEAVVRLIGNKTKWTHRRYAKLADGTPVGHEHHQAVAYGSAGALYLLGGADEEAIANVYGAFVKAARALHPDAATEVLTPESFNDHFPYEETMKVWNAVVADLQRSP